MRILTISLNAWNEKLATGNSFSNFFANLGPSDKIANIYCRNELVDNKLCDCYFRITEIDILKGIMHLSSCGKEYNPLELKEMDVRKQSILASNNPKGNKLRRKRPASLLFIREFIWSLGTWKNNRLKNFLDDFKPDIIYMHGHTNWYMHKLLWFCKKYTGAKVALFSGDDIFSCHRAGALQRLYHWILRSKLYYSFTHADIVFGGSPQLCKEYSAILGIKIYPLYKTCYMLNKPFLHERNFPLQMVYCGNLLYGRDEVLHEVVKQLKILNREKTILQMHIYSSSVLELKYEATLNDGIDCFFEGAKDFSTIEKILDKCDFCLFAESYSEIYTKTTRLSFSTKIIDYLRANSALVIIGPSNIASIDYLKKANIGFYVDDVSNFSKIIRPVLNNKELINEKIVQKYNFAHTFHNRPMLVDMLRSIVDK